MKTTLIFRLFLLAVSLFTFLPHTATADITKWSLPDGAVARLGKGTIDDVTYSPDGKLLAVASEIGIWLYDAHNGQELNLIVGHTDEVYSVSFSPDGKTIASGSTDNTVRLWDVQTGIEKLKLTGHWDRVYSVHFSPDGQTIASGSWDGTVRLWDVQTGLKKLKLIGHTDRVYSVHFSPDGQTIASGSWDGTVRLWDVQTGLERQKLTEHTDGVINVSFSPDGQTIASGSEDNTIRLWDVQTGIEKQKLIGHTGGVYSVSFSPDGQTIASGSWDGTVLLWRVMPTGDVTFQRKGDVNGDGIVNIQDLVLVAAKLGQTGTSSADVNGDGQVNIQDLVLVAGALGTSAAAPSLHPQAIKMLTVTEVKQWVSAAQQLDLTDIMSQRGILFLQQLLIVLTPKETVLLANYPNPFNPETWIPYHLAKDADVTLHIYAVNGTLVRTLTLGHQLAGMYQNRSRAAYWDGKNEFGEKVASGLYFYRLTAGDFSATRKMLIRK